MGGGMKIIFFFWQNIVDMNILVYTCTTNFSINIVFMGRDKLKYPTKYSKQNNRCSSSLHPPL